MASIIGATHGKKNKLFELSPYDLLCQKNNILLMDWKKNTKPTKTDINKWIEINKKTSSSDTKKSS